MVLKLINILGFKNFFMLYRVYFSFLKNINNFLVLKLMNIKPLGKLDLNNYKKSDKLFVIGSGESLNNLTPEEWGEISRNDSFGFNFSLYHKHIPTFYTIEGMKPRNLNENGRSPVAEKFYTITKKRMHAYKNVIKILTDMDIGKVKYVKNYLHNFLDEKGFLIKTENCVSRNQADLDLVISCFKKDGLYDESGNIKSISKIRASVSMIINVGIKLGYKEIILCGIDLNSKGYFYQNKDIYPEIEFFASSPPTNVHTTLQKKDLLPPIDLVIKTMNDNVCKPKGIVLSIANPNSALNYFLPVYKFNNG